MTAIVVDESTWEELLKRIREVVEVRLQNTLEETAKECEHGVAQKRNEFAFRSAGGRWGGEPRVLRDVYLEGFKELLEHVWKLYQELLFEAGLDLDQEIVSFISNDLQALCSTELARVSEKIPDWCAGGLEMNTQHWKDDTRKEYEHVLAQKMRDMDGALKTSSLRKRRQRETNPEIVTEHGDFISPNDISKVSYDRIRAFLVELNVCWRNTCPNAAGLLIRAITSNLVDAYFERLSRAIELNRLGLQERLQRMTDDVQERTVKEALTHLKGNAKILGDLAAHSNAVTLEMPDISNCQAQLKALIWKIFP